MDKIKLEEIIKTSKTQTECLNKMGLRAAGGNYKTLKKYIEKYSISTDHFKPDEVRLEKLINLGIGREIEIENVLISGSTYNRVRLKERLYNLGLKNRCCEIC